MPLRNPNNPTPDATLASKFINILVGYPTANTLAGITPWPVVYNQAFAAYTGAFPMVLVNVGHQNYERASRATWMGHTTFYTDVYDRWDQQPSTLDAILANLAAEVERMKANIESNESLAQNNVAYAVSAYRHELSPYEGATRTLNGMKFIYRRYSVSFWLLPYDA